MIKALRRLLGLVPCSICGKAGNGVWERKSTNLHYLTSTTSGEKWMKTTAVIDVRGLCGSCFTPRADAAMKAVEAAFDGIFPEVKEIKL